jgi:hypothetical protein
MAIGLIKDCYKEKMEILTSQAAVNHALDFIDKTNNQIKQEFNRDMQAVIKDAIENNPEIQSSSSTHSTTGSTHYTQTRSSASSEQQQEQDQGEEEFAEQEDFEDEEEEEERPEHNDYLN